MSEMEHFIQDCMNKWKVPGCAVAIVKDDQILMSKGFGVKRLKDDKIESNLVDDHTLFPIASLTKPFTALAIGLLVDRKQLEWHDPIIKFYPDLNLSDSYAREHLTIKDCLSMHSGLPGPSAYALPWYRPENSQDDLIQKMAELPFNQGFRGSFGYQNLLYLLIAKVIQSHQHMPWEAFIQSQILDVLQMKQTTLTLADLQANLNKAYPHQMKEQWIQENAYEDLDYLAPGAGMSSSAADMAKWLLMLCQQDQMSRQQLIQPSTLKEIFSPQVIATLEGFIGEENKDLKDTLFPTSHFLNYGYGCFIHDYKGKVMCQVPGLADGMTALMVYVPELNLGIVVLSNLEIPFFTRAVAFKCVDDYLASSKATFAPE